MGIGVVIVLTISWRKLQVTQSFYIDIWRNDYVAARLFCSRLGDHLVLVFVSP